VVIIDLIEINSKVIPATATFRLAPSSLINKSGLKAHKSNAIPVGTELPARALFKINSRSFFCPAAGLRNKEIPANKIANTTVIALR
jgi:hypothetical protein